MTNKIVMLSRNNTPIANMFNNMEGFLVVPKIQTSLKPDLIVFPGGADINPSLYKESRLNTTHFDLAQDEQDLDFYDKYQEVPKIGICRGAQLLNVLSGGKLYQHVDNHRQPHDIIDALFSKNALKVTSTHHQMMIPAEAGEVLAFAMEAENYFSGISRDKPSFDTEVVWYEHTQALCFQPHPEFDLVPKNDHRKYFFDLIDHFFN